MKGLKNIQMNYRRLARHYEENLKSRDEVTLLDLAHTLRMWVDMKMLVDEFIKIQPLFHNFVSYTPSRKLTKILKSNSFIVAKLSSEAYTWENNENLFHLDSDVKNPCTISLEAMKDNMQRFHVRSVVAIDGYQATRKELNIFKVGFKKTEYSSFSEWLAAEIARVGFLNKDGSLEEKIISRGMFISRVANVLGGSHPEGLSDSDNKFNGAVKYLSESHVAGLSIPYFLSLSIAKDILYNIRFPEGNWI